VPVRETARIELITRTPTVMKRSLSHGNTTYRYNVACNEIVSGH